MTVFSQYRSQEPLSEVTIGQRIAGGLLILNAGMVLVETLVLDGTVSALGVASSPGTGLVAAAIDVFIGVSLLRGSRTLVPWAIFRAGAGLLLNVGLQLAANNWLGAIQAAIFCAAILALLIGDASKLRRGFSITGVALVFLLEIAALVIVTTGSNPAGALIASVSGSIEGEPVKHVTGGAYAYSLELPNDRWYLRTAQAAKKDNPVVDKWLIRPDIDAHIIVIPEHIPGATISIEAYTDAMIKGSTTAMTRFSVERREPWAAYPQNGRALEATAELKGLTFFYSIRLVAAGDRAVQVLAFGSPKVSEDARAEMRQIIDTLKLPPGTRLIAPDLEDGVAGKVTGVSYGYTVETPSDKWHVRKVEAAQQANPLADRWLVRPDVDAHIIIVAEHEPGSAIEIDAYTDAVLSIAEGKAQTHQLLERKPWTAMKQGGRFAHTRSTVNGVSVEHFYGLLTQGDRAFQVIGLAPRSTFGAAAPDILHILNSFTLPAVNEADPPRESPPPRGEK